MLEQGDATLEGRASEDGPKDFGVTCDDAACNQTCKTMLGYTGGYCNHYKLCTCMRIPRAKLPFPAAPRSEDSIFGPY